LIRGFVLERFPEYQKAIPFLTIPDDERIKLENEKLKQDKKEKEDLKKSIKEIKEDLEKVKKRQFRAEKFHCKTNN